MPDENRTPPRPPMRRAHQPGLPLRLVREPRAPERAAERAARGASEGRVGIDLRARTPQPSRPVHQEAPRRGWPWDRHHADARHTSGQRPRTHGRLKVLLLLMVVVGLVAVVVWALTAPQWQVRWVQVNGTDDTTLVSAIHALPLADCNIFRCDTDHRAALVAALPAVAHAEVHTAYPDGLIVMVTPRHPALLWQMDGQALVVADDGTVLGTRDSNPAYSKMPLQEIADAQATAFGGHLPGPGTRLDVTITRMASQLRSNLAGAAGSGWTLSYSADQGFVAANATGQQVLFGTPQDAVSALNSNAAPAIATQAPSAADAARGAQVQLAELHALVTQLSGRHERAVVIDLRWGAHPYYRLAG